MQRPLSAPGGLKNFEKADKYVFEKKGFCYITWIGKEIRTRISKIKQCILSVNYLNTFISGKNPYTYKYALKIINKLKIYKKNT